MAIAHSKLTAQGQISVPAEVRKKLGVGPGSTIEWAQEGDSVIVRRAGKFSSEEIHQRLFPDGPPKGPGDVKKAIEDHIRRKHARD
jgi:AbrB family looped-hinge helix DNA binding protein